jgi:hypothetical protein
MGASRLLPQLQREVAALEVQSALSTLRILSGLQRYHRVIGVPVDLSDEERVLKLIERVRLLIAIDDDMPVEIKLNTQPALKMLEAAIQSDDVGSQQQASGYYSLLYDELADNPNLEALLSAMRVFLPYL